MRLTLLGSAGWMPHSNRETCSALVRDGERALLLDAGSGLRRLLEFPRLTEGLAELDIVLTHFHHDHVLGLDFVPALALPRPRIWAPGKWLYREKSEKLLRLCFSHPQSAIDLKDIGDVHELGPKLELGPFSLRLRKQPKHSDATVGIRLSDWLSYITDTAYDAETAAFCRGAKLLFHEAWSLSTSPLHHDKHATAKEAAQVAQEAEVEQLVLIHLNPRIANQRQLLAEARATFANVELGCDWGTYDRPDGVAQPAKAGLRERLST